MRQYTGSLHKLQSMQERMNSVNDSGSGIESKWEIVLRSQSTSGDSKFSLMLAT